MWCNVMLFSIFFVIALVGREAAMLFKDDKAYSATMMRLSWILLLNAAFLAVYQVITGKWL